MLQRSPSLEKKRFKWHVSAINHPARMYTIWFRANLARLSVGRSSLGKKKENISYETNCASLSRKSPGHFKGTITQPDLCFSQRTRTENRDSLCSIFKGRVSFATFDRHGDLVRVKIAEATYVERTKHFVQFQRVSFYYLK